MAKSSLRLIRISSCFLFFACFLLTACKSKAKQLNTEGKTITAKGSYDIYIDTLVAGEQIKAGFKEDTLIVERKLEDSTYIYLTRPFFDHNIKGGIDIYDGKAFYNTDFLVIDSFCLLAFRTPNYMVSILAFNRNEKGFHFINQRDSLIVQGRDPYLLSDHNNFVIYNKQKKDLIYFDYYNESISDDATVKKCDAYIISFMDYSIKANKKPFTPDGNEFLTDSLIELFKRKLVVL